MMAPVSQHLSGQRSSPDAVSQSYQWRWACESSDSGPLMLGVVSVTSLVRVHWVRGVVAPSDAGNSTAKMSKKSTGHLDIVLSPHPSNPLHCPTIGLELTAATCHSFSYFQVVFLGRDRDSLFLGETFYKL